MLLANKNAIIYGGGVIGGAVAQAFARQGARVFLAGHTPARLEAIAREIAAWFKTRDQEEFAWTLCACSTGQGTGGCRPSPNIEAQ